MKKFLVASLVCCVSVAHADSVSFIKQMYQQARTSQADYGTILRPRADSGLNRL